jgi:hypothetical protein
MALSMGVLYPSDVSSGKLDMIPRSSSNAIPLMDSLQRPVHAAYADLNGDRLEDIVVCEFGNTVGQLGWLEQRAQHKLIKHVLRGFPGSVKTEIFDFNKDGMPDIMALMAQGMKEFLSITTQGTETLKRKGSCDF